jgi:hypothetical protein
MSISSKEKMSFKFNIYFEKKNVAQLNLTNKTAQHYLDTAGIPE